MTREEAFNLTPGETVIECEIKPGNAGPRVATVLTCTRLAFTVSWGTSGTKQEWISAENRPRLLQLQRGGPPATGLAPELDAATFANLQEHLH